jgi:hypothetical protein
MTNKAAERLRRQIRAAIRGMDLFWRNEDTSRLADAMTQVRERSLRDLDEALDAERRATVERIRLEVRLSAFAANNPNSKGYAEILAILDDEAAR